MSFCRVVVQLVSLKSDVPLTALWERMRVLRWGYLSCEWSPVGGHPSSAGDFHQQPGPKQASCSSTTQCDPHTRKPDPHLIRSNFWNTLFNHLPAAASKLFQKTKVNMPLEWVGSFSWIPGNTGRKKRNWLQCHWLGTGLMSAQPCCAALLHCFATACHSKSQYKNIQFYWQKFAKF